MISRTIRGVVRYLFWGVVLALLAFWVHSSFLFAPPGHTLVVIRGGAVLPEPIPPGGYGFLPDRVLPGRVESVAVRTGISLLPLELHHPLDQGEILGLDESFSIRLALSLEYSLTPEGAVAILSRGDPHNPEAIQSYLTLHLRSALQARVEQIYGGGVPLGVEENLKNYLRSQELLVDLNRALSLEGVSLVEATPREVYVPDAGRYRAVLARGGEILQSRMDHLQELKREEERNAVRDRALYSRMERVGEILRRRPELKDWAIAERLRDNVRVVLVPSGPGETPLSAAQAGNLAESASARPAPETGEAGEEGGPSFVDLTPP